MTFRKRFAVVCLILGTVARTANADTLIATVPYHIKKAGTYRVIHDLVTDDATHPAIRITASNVTLDFDNHTLSASASANLATVFGVDIEGSNVKVRNGTIVGFGRAVNGYNNTVASDATTLEDLTCQSQIGNASIYLSGVDTLLRRVRVTNPSLAVSAPVGIYANYSSLIESCSVSDLHATNGEMAIGFELDTGSGSE